MVNTPDAEHLPTSLEQEAALDAFLKFFCRPGESEMWAMKVSAAKAAADIDVDTAYGV